MMTSLTDFGNDLLSSLNQLQDLKEARPELVYFNEVTA